MRTTAGSAHAYDGMLCACVRRRALRMRKTAGSANVTVGSANMTTGFVHFHDGEPSIHIIIRFMLFLDAHSSLIVPSPLRMSCVAKRLSTGSLSVFRVSAIYALLVACQDNLLNESCFL